EVRTDGPKGEPAGSKAEVLAVVSFGDPAAADYAAYVGQRGTVSGAVVAASPDELQAVAEHGRVAALVLFLPPRLRDRDCQALDAIFRLALEWQTEVVAIVSTFRVHLGDPGATQAEDHVLARAKGLPARTVVFRPGHVLSLRSRAGARLRRIGFLYPVVPRR